MKIAFAGDSFCMNVFPNTPAWPHLVATGLNAKIIQKGHSGQHFYQAVDELLLNVFDADYIILCVSEPYRVINNYNLPVNMTWVEQMMSKTGDHWENRQKLADDLGLPAGRITKIVKAAHGYYNYLYSKTAVEFQQIGLISFIDNILKLHNKKTIWLPCFWHSFALPAEYWNSGNSKTNKFYHKIINPMYIPVSGPSANIPLFKISWAELEGEGYTEDEIEHWVKNDSRNNHFNDENNINMANLIINIINNDDFTSGVIKMEEYFPQLNLDKLERMR